MKDAHQWPLTVPEAYQQWARIVNGCSAGGFQARDVLSLDRDSADSESVGIYSAEVITRATFEVAMSMHFDRTDSKMDLAVLRMLCGLSDRAKRECEHAIARYRVRLRPGVDLAMEPEG